MGMEWPNLNNKDERTEHDIDLNRRNFLKLAVAGAASLLISPDEAFSKQEKKVEKPDVKIEMLQHGNQRKMVGESTSLNALHDAVSDDFEAVIAREIKNPSSKFAVSNFKAHIGHKDGKYTLAYSVDLVPVEKEEKAHRVFSVRGKVWSGAGARKGVHDLYDKTVVPWQHRMRETYPDVDFSDEVQEDGNDTLYQKTCIMKGAIRK